MVRPTPDDRDARTVTLSRKDCAALGIDPADTAITLPAGFAQMTAAERAHWAEQTILADLTGLWRELMGPGVPLPHAVHEAVRATLAETAP